MPPKFRKELNGSQKEQQALLESSDEDFFLKGPIVPNVTITNSSGRNNTITRVQNQVDEVVDMMQTNIGRVLERGERLEDLQDKSDNLINSSQAFKSKATSLRKNLWWKECRMRILLGVVITAILIIIITAIVVQSRKE